MSSPVRNHPSRKVAAIPARKPGEVEDRPERHDGDVDVADPKATEREPVPHR